MRPIIGSVCVIVITATAACSQGAPASLSILADDLRAIDAVRDEHVMAVNSTDADLLLRGMSESVVYLGPAIDPVVGAVDLRALVEPMYQQIRPQITMTARDVQVVGDVAYEWGMIGGTLVPGPGAPPQELNAKYVFIYRRQPDSSWRIVYDIYNDNASPVVTSAGGQ